MAENKKTSEKWDKPVTTTFKAENWNKPTPKFWRNIGDAFLALGTGLNSAFALAPIPEPVKVWLILGTSVIATIGKFATKLFHTNDNENG